REVARAGTDLKHAVAGSNSQPVEMISPQRWLAGVESSALVQRDQDVVVEVARIGVGRRPVAVADMEDAPGTRADEALARHGSKRVDHALVAETSDEAQLLGERAPGIFDGSEARHLEFPHLHLDWPFGAAMDELVDMGV